MELKVLIKNITLAVLNFILLWW